MNLMQSTNIENNILLSEIEHFFQVDLTCFLFFFLLLITTLHIVNTKMCLVIQVQVVFSLIIKSSLLLLFCLVQPSKVRFKRCISRNVYRRVRKERTLSS
ncbi:hypothetical protein BD408DRAFT_93099 [Parasitella parasitica]|nr:hypothetical protein BD408DRAFT_93099 [Parasitella parasitica]